MSNKITTKLTKTKKLNQNNKKYWKIKYLFIPKIIKFH
jgi:hypothetical protein